MNKLIQTIAFAIAVEAGLLALPTLTITDTVTLATVTVVDGGAGDTDGLVNGSITYSNTNFGGANRWNIVTTAGSSKPVVGSAALPVLNLNTTFTRKPLTAGSLLFSFSDGGFTGKPYQGTLTGAVSGISSAGNALFSSTLNGNPYNNSLPTLTWTKGSSASANNTGSAISPLGSYSLGIQFKVNVLAGVNSPRDLNRVTNVTASLDSVPEPGFYGALALGLSSLFFVASRRRHNAGVESQS